ncbi:LRP2-binding protein [Cariama cristata]
MKSPLLFSFAFKLLRGELNVHKAEDCSRAALFAKAEELLAKRSAGGDPLAPFLKGQLYYEEHLVVPSSSLPGLLRTRITENDDIDMVAKTTDGLPTSVAKGAAMAAFYLARCLQRGVGIQQDQAAAKKYYSKCLCSLFSKACLLDPGVASDLELAANLGRI